MSYINILKIILLTLLASQCNLQSVDQKIPIEVLKCTQFKKEVFEEVKTFSFLIHGAKPKEFVDDYCEEYSPFIVNGIPAKPKEFPQMALLGRLINEEIKWFCGGTLISDRYVLTASHCFYSEHGEVDRVRLGELDLDDDDAEHEDFTIIRTIKHPDYDWKSPSIYNDIGLIELAKKVNFTRYKHPACLPSKFNGDEFFEYIATGWGSTGNAAPSSKQLLKVKLDRFSYGQCSKHTNTPGNDMLPRGLDRKSQICAGSNKKRDTCYGDSGGPLLVYHPDYPCMYIVVGITSTGISGCGTQNVPAIYTRVNNYLEWITEIVF